MNLSAEQILIKLQSLYNLNFQSIQDLKIGTNLIKIVNKLLYNNQNKVLLQKITTPTNNRAGNNGITINLLLKHIKQDPQLTKDIPTQIRQLTFFNLLQDESKLIMFINWVLEKTSITIQNQDKNYEDEQINTLSSNRFKNIQINALNPLNSNNNNEIKTKSKIYYNEKDADLIEEPSHISGQRQIKQNNGFENLYFASHIKEKNQSPEKQIKNDGDKIVRKGSFKLIKPKVTLNINEQMSQGPKQLEFSPKKNVYNQQQHHSLNLINQKQPTNSLLEPEQLKQISMIHQSTNNPNISGLQMMNSSNIYIDDDYQHHHHQFNNNLNNNYHDNDNNKSITTTPIPKFQMQQNRKTIPKNLSKPPLYRNLSSEKNKQNMMMSLDKKSITFEQTVDRNKRQKMFFNQSSNQIDRNKNRDENHFIIHQDVSSFSGTKNHQNYYQNIKNENKNVKNNLNIPPRQLKKQNLNTQLKQYFQQKQNSLESQTQNNINSSQIIHAKNKYLKYELLDLENQISKQSSELLTFNTNINYQSAPIHSNHILTNKNSSSNNHKEQSNPEMANQNHSKPNLQRKRINSSTRKVLKINLNPLQQTQQHQIIQWLISINLLTIDQIDQVLIESSFNNGVRFVEICNYYIGRGKQLPYFSNPRKNAEIHSNYSKIFQFLKSITYFQSELLFAYEFFIPQPYQNAIWNLLYSMFKVFYKKGKTKNQQNQLIDNKQNEIKRSISKPMRKDLKNTQPSMTDRYQSNKKSSKKLTKSRSSSMKGNFNTPIQFVREIPEQLKHKDLVQNIQPQNHDDHPHHHYINEQNIWIDGYKQRYFKKALASSTTMNASKIHTPKKNIVMNNQESLVLNNTRNLIKHANMLSSKKALRKSLQKSQSSASKYLKKSNEIVNNHINRHQMPKVTLNMQMKVLRLLKNLNLSIKQNDKITEVDLFSDPIRNGTLINVLLQLDYSNKSQHKYFNHPKSIQNCRQNYIIALSLIKSKYGQQQLKGNQIYSVYFPFIEQIIKSEKNLFYGIAYSLIEIFIKKGVQIKGTQNNYQNQSSTKIRAGQKEKFREIVKQFQMNPIDWIRYLERLNPKIADLKIRDQDSLKQTVSSGVLIYYLCRMIINHGDNVTLVYQRPINTLQKQVNLKKIFTHLYLNNILQKDHFKGIQKQLAEKSTKTIDFIIATFIPLTLHELNLSEKQHLMIHKNHINSTNVIKSTTLNKYINQDYVMNERNKRLQTTADEVEQNYHNHQLQNGQNQKMYESSAQIQQQPEIEIAWMRKLGFTNCSLSLKNGVLLCRLISKLTRNNIIINENLTSNHNLTKPECLLNIRKSLKLLPGSKWDEIDIYQANHRKTIQIYNFIRDKFKHTYEMSRVLSNILK